MKAPLLSYLLEASICFEVLYLFYWLALQKTTFFVANRFYLLAMATAAWFIPLLEFKPETLVFAQSRAFAQIPHTISVIETPIRITQSSVVWSDVVLWIYVTGVVIFASRFLWRLGKLYWLIRRSVVHRNTSCQRIDTEGKLPTFSFLHYLFWDNTALLTEAEKEQIFQHELVHIREKHSWDILYAELLKVVFWMNPAVYLFKNELHLLHEYRADALMAQLYGKNTYTETLLDIFFKKLQLTFSHSFNQSSIHLRTTMLQKSASTRIHLWRLLGVIPLLVGLLGVFAFQSQRQLVATKGLQWLSDSQKPQLELVFLGGEDSFSISNADKISFKYSAIHTNTRPMEIQVKASVSGSRDSYAVRQMSIFLIDGPRPLKSQDVSGDKINIQPFFTLAKPGMRVVIEVKKVVALLRNNKEAETPVAGSPLIPLHITE